MASLAQARRALDRRQPEQALRLLEQSDRLDPDDAFATERAVTRVWALCAADRVSQARTELHRLQRRGEAAAYADTLSRSCVAELIGSEETGDQGG